MSRLPKAEYFQKRYESALNAGLTDKANYYKGRLEQLNKPSKDVEYIKVNKANLIAFLNAQASKTHLHIMGDMANHATIKAMLEHLELPLSNVFECDEQGELLHV